MVLSSCVFAELPKRCTVLRNHSKKCLCMFACSCLVLFRMLTVCFVFLHVACACVCVFSFLCISFMFVFPFPCSRVAFFRNRARRASPVRLHVGRLCASLVKNEKNLMNNSRRGADSGWGASKNGNPKEETNVYVVFDAHARESTFGALQVLVGPMGFWSSGFFLHGSFHSMVSPNMLMSTCF